MAEPDGTETADPLPQPSLSSELAEIKAMLSEVLAGQKLLSQEMREVRQEIRDRYVDLRERIEISNDKLYAVQRDFNQLARDLRGPSFDMSGARIATGANTVTD